MNFAIKRSTRKLVISALVAFAAVIVLHEIWHCGFCPVYVEPDEALLVINKFGDPLPPDRIVVPAGDDQYKGVQAELPGPGRYFISPVSHDWKIVPLVEIPAGEPQKWAFDAAGHLTEPDTAPKIGLVSLKEGKEPPPGQEVVEAGYKGLQREVLTPGIYKINPQQYEITLYPAAIVPPDSVGVVTRLSGEIGNVASSKLSGPASSGAATEPITAPTRLAVGANQRGILTDVLQPGIYYLNPRLAKVTVVPVGYDAITLDHDTNTSVRFYSNDCYQIEADFTVVWGRSPSDAPQIVANIGNVDKVRENVIEPAMKAAFQNEGARHSAKELIQGTSRFESQGALSASLEQQVSARNVHILLALIRNIFVKDTSGNDATGGLLATFAKNFEPTDLRLIFAGPRTFWTDLKSFQDVAASKVLQKSEEKK